MAVPGGVWLSPAAPSALLGSGWHEAPGVKASRELQVCEALFPTMKSKTWKTAGIWLRRQEAFLNRFPKGFVGAGGTEGPTFNPCPPAITARDPKWTGHPWKSPMWTFPHHFSSLQERGFVQPLSAPKPLQVGIREPSRRGLAFVNPWGHRPPLARAVFVFRTRLCPRKGKL